MKVNYYNNNKKYYIISILIVIIILIILFRCLFINRLENFELLIESQNKYVSQFIIENLVIAESYNQRPNETIKSFIKSKNRKEEFTKIATDNFRNELKNFYERSYGSTNSL